MSFRVLTLNEHSTAASLEDRGAADEPRDHIFSDVHSLFFIAIMRPPSDIYPISLNRVESAACALGRSSEMYRSIEFLDNTMTVHIVPAVPDSK